MNNLPINNFEQVDVNLLGILLSNKSAGLFVESSPRTASHCIFGTDCIPISVCLASSEWFSQLWASWQINAFLQRIYMCGFLRELIQLEALTLAADKRLFAKMCGQVQSLHSLLPPATNYSLKHRPEGHTFELSHYSYDFSRKSLVLRCLYEVK